VKIGMKDNNKKIMWNRNKQAEFGARVNTEGA
jgi:hypothetical protein